MTYHSINPSDPDVWHDNEACPAGKRIPPQNRRSGKGPYNRKCERC
jgi:hypothetical protein